MAFFLLVDNNPDAITSHEVVNGSSWDKSKDPTVTDYMTWSKTGDVLQLDLKRFLVRLGAYRLASNGGE